MDSTQEASIRNVIIRGQLSHSLNQKISAEFLVDLLLCHGLKKTKKWLTMNLSCFLWMIRKFMSMEVGLIRVNITKEMRDPRFLIWFSKVILMKKIVVKIALVIIMGETKLRLETYAVKVGKSTRISGKIIVMSDFKLQRWKFTKFIDVNQL